MKAFLNAKLVNIFLFVILLLLCGNGSASAHATGASWEKVVNGYKLDIGYDPTTIVAGQSQRFDFDIDDPSSGQSVDFSDVWVRISNGQDTVFATGIHRLTFGLTALTMEFPAPGNYNLNARFEKDGNTIVQSDFPVTVLPADSVTSQPTSSRTWIKNASLGFLGGAVAASLAFFIFRKFRAKK